MPQIAVAASMMDAAATIGHLQSYWADAQDLYTNEICSMAERSTMRGRAMKEYFNSGYIRNAVRMYANHIIGADGPTLRLLPECGLDKEDRAKIEWAFWNWQNETEDVEKLRLIPKQLMIYGEAFERFIYDRYIDESELNVQDIEPKRIDYPWGTTDPNMIDGIRFHGVHPQTYYVEKREINPVYSYLDYEQVPADHIMHTFIRELPEQRRGTPIIATVLRLQAEAMLWEAHTLGAADWAANWGGFIRTNGQWGPSEVADINFDTFQMQAPTPGRPAFCPEGWAPEQVKPEFPTSNFEGFSNCLTRETAAGIGSEKGIMMADTSGYNYSSFRGSMQNYWVTISATQALLKRKALRPRFEKFLECHASYWKDVESAWIAQKLLMAFNNRPWLVPYDFRFPKPPSIDPEKDEKANQLALANRTKSRHMIAAENGYDYDEIKNELLEEKKDFPNAGASGPVAASGGGMESLLASLKEDTEQSLADPAQAAPIDAKPTVSAPSTIDPLDGPKRLLTARQAADKFGVSASSIGTWRKHGLKWYKLGNTVKYDESELTKYINSAAQGGQDPNGE